MYTCDDCGIEISSAYEIEYGLCLTHIEEFEQELADYWGTRCCIECHDEDGELHECHDGEQRMLCLPCWKYHYRH